MISRSEQVGLIKKYRLPWSDPRMTAEEILAMPFKIHRKGYAIVKIPGHPCAWKNRANQVRRSHAVLWACGRPVGPRQVAHHIDENKLHDDPSNLIVIGHGAHTRLHNDGHGRDPGFHHSEETKRKIGLKAMGNQRTRGLRWSPEHRERFLAARAATGNKYVCRKCNQPGHNARTCKATSN